MVCWPLLLLPPPPSPKHQSLHACRLYSQCKPLSAAREVLWRRRWLWQQGWWLRGKRRQRRRLRRFPLLLLP